MLVAAGVDAVLRHDEEGERAFDHIERFADGEDAGPVVLLVVLADQVGQDLAVRGRLEQAAAVLQVAAQLRGIHQVAVVREGKVARIVVEEERLDVLDAAAARGGIAYVADGHLAGQRGDFRFVEDLVHQAFALDAAQHAVFSAGDDAATFLPPVLQGVKSVIH